MPASQKTAPTGCTHKIKPARIIPLRPSALTPEQQAIVNKEIKNLPELIKSTYTKWTNGAKPFQLDAITAQLQGRDVMIHAATGSGKTGIAAAPHLLPSSQGKVTLVISPIIALQDEQVKTFTDEFHLKATAINSGNGGCGHARLAVRIFLAQNVRFSLILDKSIVSGQYQVVILSPEMLLSRRFVDGVLRQPEFASRCLSIFVDEAHCVSNWGSSFRKKYGSIGIVRGFLAKDTPIVAASATLTARVKDDLADKLQFNQSYLDINIGNERSNISQIVRSMEHSMSSYHDLDFLIPTHTQSHHDIPKTFLYCDNINEGIKMVDYLNSRLPEHLQAQGLVQPYNAVMSRRYRTEAMLLYILGIIRILVCTDAAGMGCNIPDIDIVVQWKTPHDLSSWVQRAGRAARASGRVGLAVLVVEKSAFDLQSLTGKSNEGGQKKTNTYANAHGARRGHCAAKYDEMVQMDEDLDMNIPRDAPKEGLYSYIQTTQCRRRVIASVFGNKLPGVIPDCCDICNPRLFDRARPGKSDPSSRNQTVPKGAPVDSVREALYNWRVATKARLYRHAMWGPHALLDDDTCEILASIGPVETKEQLALTMEKKWARWEVLGDSLFEMLSKLDIPALSKKAKKRTATLTSIPACPPSPSKRSRTGSSRRVETGPIVFEESQYDSFFASLRGGRN